MNTLEFLRLVWADGPGYFCIVTPNTKGGRGFFHYPFDSIEAACAKALSFAGKTDTFFNVHTLHEEKVWDADKDNHKGGKGAYAHRIARNLRGCKCCFADLDVGNSKGYTTREAARIGLDHFIGLTGLPRPMIVSSGGGFHLYWLFDRELEAEAWRELATKLKLLMAQCAFHVDPVRTKDASSVLRVPHTHNMKDPTNPREVLVEDDGDGPMAVERFIHLVELALAATAPGQMLPPVEGSLFPVDMTKLPEGQKPDWYTDPPSVAEVGKACGHFRWAAGHQPDVTEPQWYNGILNLARWTKEGRPVAHALSNRHPHYLREDTDAKLDQLEKVITNGRPLGPTTCGKMGEVFGLERCLKCQFHGHPMSSPIAHARHLPAEKSAEEKEAGLPDPPHPYTRLGKNGVRYAPVDGEPPRIICEFDLYPVRTIFNEDEKRTDIEWVLAMPLRGNRQFAVPADALADLKRLEGILRNQGLMTPHENYKYIREYMSAYIKQLQQYVVDSKQQTHLGWAKDFAYFVLPDRIVTEGVSSPVVLNDNVQNASVHIRKKGSQERQVELLKFYCNEAYTRQQFMIACGLAAPLLHATDKHGVLINMSGDSGASKSTSLYTAASLWGEPEASTINGTNDGATVRARNERTLLMSNLPVCVDEITMMEALVAKNLAMSITQEGGRIRLDGKGVERKQVAAMKSTFMLCTSNNSLHELLSNNNAAGTAGSMRVFEIHCPRVFVHSKREADDYFRELKQNFGHLGPAWIDHLTRHRLRLVLEVIEMGRRIDDMGGVAQHERFWGATIAVVLVTIREARKIGLLPYAYDPIEAWAIGQLNSMRSAVTANYSDPVDSLMGYVSANISNLLAVRIGRETTLVRPPRGELAGRYEVNTRALYLTHSGLKAYCIRNGIPLGSMLSELKRKEVAQSTRMSLGKGLPEYNIGQHSVLQVDMKHPLLAGRIDLDEMVAEDHKVVAIR